MKQPFDVARRIADAVLYEGYLLYPYRASSRKNQLRWQFGVLAPRAWSETGGCESSWMQTECLIEPSGVGVRPALVGVVRFLQLQRRSVDEVVAPELDGGPFRPTDALEVEGQLWTAWDEGVEREIELSAAGLAPGVARLAAFTVGGGRDTQPVATGSGRVVGRVVRERWPIHGQIRVSVEQAAEADVPSPLLRVRVRVENLSPGPGEGAPREEALRTSAVGTHLLLAVEGGAFVSLLDPPEWARPAAAACSSVRSWPVLAGSPGETGVVLAAPIILYDHPQVAPESQADFFDATEIDELLALRTMTLTDAEKREARATDPRAAAIVDRVDRMESDALERLHGAVRSLRPIDDQPARAEPPAWWDPGADASVSPETDTVDIGGVPVARGSRVRLRPGRRADAQDMFLAGRVASVAGVFLDVEERRYVAVTLADDPGADLQLVHGRYLYFYPDEIEPLAEGAEA
ncbi:MAG TPA: hypothetical protein VKB80_17270 [Kofleriaceae bacterium]|nr:hypothetical protein [Kofleriaceae bacterium]